MNERMESYKYFLSLMRMPTDLILSEGKTIYIPFIGQERASSDTANVGNLMNPGIRILPLPSAKGLLGKRMSGLRSGKPLVFRMRNYR
jgi:hypothetical protein